MANAIDVALGLKIAELRALRGMTLTGLAEAVGQTPLRMAAIEAGAHVEVGTLVLISRALRVALPAFFHDLAPDASGAQSGAATVEEGLRFNRAFTRIPDPRVRALLLDIAEHFASDASD